MGLSQAWNTTEAYLALARQGRIRLLSPVIFLTCHSMNLKKISGQKTQKNKQKTPPSWGNSQPPPRSSIFLPKFPAEMDQKKNFFFLTAASSIRLFVESHYQNSHLFWWRPSPSPPAEKLLAVQRGRTESTEEVLARGERGEKHHADRGPLGSWSGMLDFTSAQRVQLWKCHPQSCS